MFPVERCLVCNGVVRRELSCILLRPEGITTGIGSCFCRKGPGIEGELMVLVQRQCILTFDGKSLDRCKPGYKHIKGREHLGVFLRLLNRDVRVIENLTITIIIKIIDYSIDTQGRREIDHTIPQTLSSDVCLVVQKLPVYCVMSIDKLQPFVELMSYSDFSRYVL